MGRYFSKPDLYCSGKWAKGLRAERVELRDAPEFMRGLRLLFAADFHLRANVPDGEAERVVGLMAGQGADMILLGGDFAEGEDQQRRMFRALSALDAPLGVYACPGNNDAESFARPKELTALARRAGVRMLVNRREVIPLPGGEIVLAGAGELKHGEARLRGLLPERPGRAEYRILLSHYPVLPEPGCGCAPDLMLSGHTHGGQLNLLGVTPYVVWRMDRGEMPRGPETISGMKTVGNTQALVSPGIGFSRINLRVGARPRIHVLEFR